MIIKGLNCVRGCYIGIRRGYSMPFPPTSYYSRLSPLYTRLSFRIGPYPTEKAESFQGNCGVLSVAPWGNVLLPQLTAFIYPHLISREQLTTMHISIIYYPLLLLSLFHQGSFLPSCLSSSCILCCLTISKNAVSVLASWIVT